jgi:hypothetical protein
VKQVKHFFIHKWKPKSALSSYSSDYNKCLITGTRACDISNLCEVMNEYKPTLDKCLEMVIRLIVVWSSFWGEDGDGDFQDVQLFIQGAVKV